METKALCSCFLSRYRHFREGAGGDVGQVVRIGLFYILFYL